MRTMTAALARPGRRLFDLVDAELSAPRDDEVLVRIHGVGICHSDVSVLEGGLPLPLPAVLGHEGSGIVTAVGRAVRTVAPGDAVVLTFRSCGRCARCAANEPAYCEQFHALNTTGCRPDGSCTVHVCGQPVTSSFFGQSSFAEFALAYESNVVKVPRDLPIERLGPLGCGIQTGAGAVMNALRCPRGSSLLITGAGSVGLSAVLAAVVQGCSRIVVSDPLPQRRALALALGATQAIDPVDPSIGSVAQAVLREGPGVDFALDTTGLPAVIREAAAALRQRGVLGLVAPSPDLADPVPLPIAEFIGRGLTVMGIVEGDSQPQRFINALIDLHRAGRFPFDRLITPYPFADINTALADLRSGACVKAVLLTQAAGDPS
jgi:aryl-alcohol dehydrogenase